MPAAMPAGPASETTGPRMPASFEPLSQPAVDPGALRVTIAPASYHEGDEAIIVAPTRHEHPVSDGLIVGGDSIRVRLIWHDPHRGTIQVGEGSDRKLQPVLFGTRRPPGLVAIDRLEVVVGGWRFELEVEPERRAQLRERARRGRTGSAHGGPADVRAMIPGRVVAVSVVAGDHVEAGQQLLVIEAMKMQNEVRAPIAERIGAAEGRTVELGDVLVVLRP